MNINYACHNSPKDTAFHWRPTVFDIIACPETHELHLLEISDTVIMLTNYQLLKVSRLMRSSWTAVRLKSSACCLFLLLHFFLTYGCCCRSVRSAVVDEPPHEQQHIQLAMPAKVRRLEPKLDRKCLVSWTSTSLQLAAIVGWMFATLDVCYVNQIVF
jgi:hypothetical protein